MYMHPATSCKYAIQMKCFSRQGFAVITDQVIEKVQKSSVFGNICHVWVQGLEKSSAKVLRGELCSLATPVQVLVRHHVSHSIGPKAFICVEGVWF